MTVTASGTTSNMQTNTFAAIPSDSSASSASPNSSNPFFPPLARVLNTDTLMSARAPSGLLHLFSSIPNPLFQMRQTSSTHFWNPKMTPRASAMLLPLSLTSTTRRLSNTLVRLLMVFRMRMSFFNSWNWNLFGKMLFKTLRIRWEGYAPGCGKAD